MTETDVDRMRALQREIGEARGQGQGAFGMDLAGCAIGAGPLPEANGLVPIREAAHGPLLPLVAQGSQTALL